MSAMTAMTRDDGDRLLVQQILRPQLAELLYVFLPCLGDASRIVAADQGVKSILIGQEAEHGVDLPVIRIELLDGSSQFDAEFRRIQQVAVRDNQVHAAAGLPGICSAGGSEGYGNEANPGDEARVEIVGEDS